uniref:Uncharacterized protein 3 n=1 Tax=Coelognathus radiatus TaxID=201391 RepID=Q7LZ29_COERA
RPLHIMVKNQDLVVPVNVLHKAAKGNMVKLYPSIKGTLILMLESTGQKCILLNLSCSGSGDMESLCIRLVFYLVQIFF